MGFQKHNWRKNHLVKNRQVIVGINRGDVPRGTYTEIIGRLRIVYSVYGLWDTCSSTLYFNNI